MKALDEQLTGHSQVNANKAAVVGDNGEILAVTNDARDTCPCQQINLVDTALSLAIRRAQHVTTTKFNRYDLRSQQVWLKRLSYMLNFRKFRHEKQQ